MSKQRVGIAKQHDCSVGRENPFIAGHIAHYKIDHSKQLLPLPVDFVRLAEGGLLVKDGDSYKGSDLNRLPEHVLYRIKFSERQDNVTYLTLNEKGL